LFDLKVPAEQTFRNLEIALAAARATTADVVKVNIYVKNYKPADSTIISEALRRAFPLHLPASTWLGVEALAGEGFLIEVDAIAVV
jgi:enamine deaminase RidA (YjgF/YER057c/UK114 family)